MIAISLYFAWTSAKKKQKNKIIFVYGINLLLNAFWSYLFFNKQNVSGAFYELIVLWFSIWIMIFITWKIEKKSAWLLFPYLLWVTFAGVLNWLMIAG